MRNEKFPLFNRRWLVLLFVVLPRREFTGSGAVGLVAASNNIGEEDVSVILNAAKQAESCDFAFREQSGNCGMGPEKKTEWW